VEDAQLLSRRIPEKAGSLEDASTPLIRRLTSVPLFRRFDLVSGPIFGGTGRKFPLIITIPYLLLLGEKVAATFFVADG
jgi:hypothetical protein